MRTPEEWPARMYELIVAEMWSDKNADMTRMALVRMVTSMLAAEIQRDALESAATRCQQQLATVTPLTTGLPAVDKTLRMADELTVAAYGVCIRELRALMPEEKK